MAWTAIPLLSTDPNFETWYNILKGDLEYLYASMSGTSQKYITLPFEGEAVADYVLDGVIIVEPITVKYWSVCTRRAPGTNAQFDLLKNGVPLNKVATINAGFTYIGAIVAVNVNFTAGDRLGMKVIAPGVGPAAEGIEAFPSYINT